MKEINKKLKKYYDKTILLEVSSKANNDKFTNKIMVLNKQKKEIETKLTTTRNYFKSLYEDKVNGIINNKQFKELIDNYNKDEDILRNQVKSINNEINYYRMKEDTSKNETELFNKYQQLKNLNKIIVDEFITKIYIGKIDKEKKTRNIQIKWNF